jgi:hypothetical protein
LAALQILIRFASYLRDFTLFFNLYVIKILTVPCCGTGNETNHLSEEASTRLPLNK